METANFCISSENQLQMLKLLPLIFPGLLLISCKHYDQIEKPALKRIYPDILVTQK